MYVLLSHAVLVLSPDYILNGSYMSKPLVMLTQKTTLVCYSILLHVKTQLLESVRCSDGN